MYIHIYIIVVAYGVLPVVFVYVCIYISCVCVLCVVC